jgi:endogenous inhibitor of DNA gyrase (YacG/DUF329 family)
METRARHACPVCDRDAPTRDAAAASSPTLRAARERPANPAFPFCSPACKLVDLGRWLSGAYRVPGPAEETASEAFPTGEGEA